MSEDRQNKEIGEDEVWPPPPRAPDIEAKPEVDPIPVQTRPGRDWAALIPGIIVALFLLLCFVLTLWFLGRLATL